MTFLSRKHRILLTLCHSPSYPAKLATDLSIAASVISPLLIELAGDKLITRKTSPSRTVICSITMRGLQQLRQAAQTHRVDLENLKEAIKAYERVK